MDGSKHSPVCLIDHEPCDHIQRNHLLQEIRDQDSIRDTEHTSGEVQLMTDGFRCRVRDLCDPNQSLTVIDLRETPIQGLDEFLRDIQEKH